MANYLKHQSELKNYFLGILFIIFYLSDFISKLGSIANNNFQYTSIFIKILFQLFFFGYILYVRNQTSLIILKGLCVLFFCFSIGSLTLLNSNDLASNYIYNVKVFDWYIFVFLIISAFHNLSNTTKTNQTAKLFLIFEYVFIINSLFIIIGIITKIQVFSSYFYGNRFGYNGLLRNATHASYIYMIFICFFYTKVRENYCFKNFLFLIFSVVISLFIGTKALYLFNLIFMLYLIFNNNKIYFFVTLSSLISLIYFGFNYIINYIVYDYFQILHNVYVEKGFWTMLFSGRNESILIKLEPYILEKWSFFNILFGGGSFNLYRTEFELIDFIWFFGFFGLYFYFYLWNKFVLDYKTILENKVLIIMFFITLLAGSFFSSVPVITFLFVYILFINKKLYGLHN